jgi:hypothetical protein
MGQELLNQTGFTKTPRKFFVATNSNGQRMVRGSAYKDFYYAVIAKDLNPNAGWSYVTFSATERNANKYCSSWNNKERTDLYEVVKCVQVTAKEARLIKKEINLEFLKQREQEIQEQLKEVSAMQNNQPTEKENN